MIERSCRRLFVLAPAMMVFCVLAAGPVKASCVVVGDSVAVGLGQAMHGCAVTARVGLSSAAAASRVGHGDRWVIASIGSNDFPRGINPAQRKQSERHVQAALAHVAASAGSRLVLVIPANAARSLVAGFAASHGVRSVSFTPGPDGIHPRSYADLAHRVRSMIGE